MPSRDYALALCVMLSLSSTEPLGAEPPPDSLLIRSNWVRPEIADGRLVVLNLRAGQGRIALRGDEEGALRQVLSLECEDARLALHFEAEEAGVRWTLDVANERDVTLTRVVGGASAEEAVFRQPKEGNVKLSIRDGAGQQQFVAPTIWHLLLSGDEKCRTTVVGMLEGLWPRLNVAVRTREVHQTLLRESILPPAHRRQLWQQWIDELSHEEYGVRQSADQKLREAGRPVLVYLSRIDLATVDPEVRMRIRRMLTDLADDSGDTPLRAAMLVHDDQGVWLRLLESAQPEHRAHARDQLVSLTQRSLEFDPSADAGVRKKQAAAVRAQLTGAE